MKHAFTEMEAPDIMLDLETLGKRPGCAILSIGAVQFCHKTDALAGQFYMVVSRKSCAMYALHEDPDTVAWWENQSEEARAVLTESERYGADLRYALEEFTRWLQSTQVHIRNESKRLDNVYVWGNGSDFDNAILNTAYHAVGLGGVPWKFYNNRCYRTLKSLLPNHKLTKREGTHHNALDDAKTQAWHAINLLQAVAPLREQKPVKYPWWRGILAMFS